MEESYLALQAFYQRLQRFYEAHPYLYVFLIFIGMAFLSGISLLLSEHFPLNPLIDGLIALIRFVGNTVYLLYIPGFLLISPKIFKNLNRVELFIFQVVGSLITIICLGLIISVNNSLMIFMGVTGVCVVFFLVSTGVQEFQKQLDDN
ncbi:MAG: hypothetical protein ACFFBD_09170 [Candidatus Hodarchaeota archaeon]